MFIIIIIMRHTMVMAWPYLNLNRSKCPYNNRHNG